MQRMGEELRRQSKSSQECGENCSSERFALSMTVFCWLSPDQSYVRDPNQRTVFIPTYIPARQAGHALQHLTKACTLSSFLLVHAFLVRPRKLDVCQIRQYHTLVSQ